MTSAVESVLVRAPSHAGQSMHAVVEWSIPMCGTRCRSGLDLSPIRSHTRLSHGDDRARQRDEGLRQRRSSPSTTSASTIADGEFIVLVGPSGCGKSTLLRMIAGLEEVTAGAIAIGGRDVTDLAPRHRDIAMVFQSYALYPHMTVRAEPRLRAQGAPDAEGRGRAARRRGGRAARARASCSTASRRSSPAASASASRWAARSCASRRRS